MERPAHTYVQLCGQFVVELRGSRVEERFPSRQGRTLFAYLVLNRARAVGRDELTEAIWGDAAPGNRAQALTVLLSKLRAAVGPDVLAGRGAVRLVLEPGARVDVEQALAAVHRAESAVVQRDWVRAWSASLCAEYVAARPLLLGQDDLPWLDGWRRRLDDTRERALETYAAACLGLGGTELAGAERAARRLIDHNPLRETAYGMLMQTLAARGQVPEATSRHAPSCAPSSASRPDPRSRAFTRACSGDARASPAADESWLADFDHWTCPPIGGQFTASSRVQGGAMIIRVGDRVVAESESTERRPRAGTVRRVLREAPSPRYEIEWDDGHTTIYTPAAGALHAEVRPVGTR